MATVCLLIRWLSRSQPPPIVWVAATVILFGSASFFLFQRQCRYYAPATLLSTIVAYLYCNWNGTRRQLLGIGVAMALLLSAQYLDYAAVVGCLLVDYGIWGRRRRAIRGSNWLILVLPQLLMAAIVCPIWNPIARAAGAIDPVSVPATHATIAATSSHEWLHGFLTLFWWNLRDLLACDFAILPLLVICPLLYFKQKADCQCGVHYLSKRPGSCSAQGTPIPQRLDGLAENHWLMRAPLALLIFLGAIAFFTAHPVSGSGNAEVRYLAPLLPLCIAISILAVRAMQFLNIATRGIVLILAGSSMFISPTAGSSAPVFESSAISYFVELWQPAGEPYAPLANWIRDNVRPHATVYVCPDWCVSPTMWHAPAPTYVWQLNDPPKPDYANLSPIYFKGRIAPDYLIAFGPYLYEIQGWRHQLATRGISYEPVATIPVYWKEMLRPELIWRSFDTMTAGTDEQVYVFKRTQQ